MNIVILGWETAESWRTSPGIPSNALGNVSIHPWTTPEQLIARVADAEIILPANKVPLSARKPLPNFRD